MRRTASVIAASGYHYVVPREPITLKNRIFIESKEESNNP